MLVYGRNVAKEVLQNPKNVKNEYINLIIDSADKLKSSN